MRYELKTPDKRLQAYVKHLVISESDQQEQSYQVLPDTSLVIGFQYRGKLNHVQLNQELELSTAGITGLQDSYRTFRHAPSTASILVIFTETGAANFLRNPLHELFEQSLSLTHFFHRQQVSETEERLMEAKNDQERIQIVESFLLQHLQSSSEDHLVARALEAIHQSKGTIRISKLAEALHTSQSPLEKRFRAVLGSSPKKFANIVRFRNLLTAMEQNDRPLTEQLISYYDQAHLIKDFKRFSSFTPEQYLKTLGQRNLE